MQRWNSEGLWKKAKLFMDKANESDHASSEFRSALTKVPLVLNADPRDDANILYMIVDATTGFPVFGFWYELSPEAVIEYFSRETLARL
jgi:hypothetical protein